MEGNGAFICQMRIQMYNLGLLFESSSAFSKRLSSQVCLGSSLCLKGGERRSGRTFDELCRFLGISQNQGLCSIIGMNLPG